MPTEMPINTTESFNNSKEVTSPIKGSLYLDFDGTLTSADEEGYYHTTGFLRSLTQKGVIEPTFWEQDKKDWETYISSPKSPEDYAKISNRVLTNLAEALAGKTTEEVQIWQDAYALENARIFSWVSDAIKLCNDKGYDIHVISGAAGPAIEGIVRNIGIAKDNIHTTSFEVVDKRYTGKIAHTLNFETKKDLVEKLLQKHPDLPSIAIGDSSGDFAMLSSVTTGILYEADPKYQSTAHENGWRTVDRDTILSTLKTIVV